MKYFSFCSLVQFSCSVVSDSSQPHGLQPPRLPCPWDFPGKNTGVGRHRLLQSHSVTLFLLPLSGSFCLLSAAAKSLQSCLTLCNPIDGSPPGSSVSGILQARTLERVAMSSSSACMHAKSLQSCLTLCDPMDSSPPSSSVHRIL